jgi:hypothetical protein
MREITVYRDHTKGEGVSYQVYIDGEAFGPFLEGDEEMEELLGSDFDENDIIDGLHN